MLLWLWMICLPNFVGLLATVCDVLTDVLGDYYVGCVILIGLLWFVVWLVCFAILWFISSLRLGLLVWLFLGLIWVWVSSFMLITFCLVVLVWLVACLLYFLTGLFLFVTVYDVLFVCFCLRLFGLTTCWFWVFFVVLLVCLEGC